MRPATLGVEALGVPDPTDEAFSGEADGAGPGVGVASAGLSVSMSSVFHTVLVSDVIRVGPLS